LIIDSRVWIRPSTNACSFFASSYSAFSLRDLGPPDRQHLVELDAELVEAVLGDVCGLGIHVGWTPEVRTGAGATARSV